MKHGLKTHSMEETKERLRQSWISIGISGLTFGLFRSEEELLEMEDSGSWSCQRGACHYGA